MTAFSDDRRNSLTSAQLVRGGIAKSVALTGLYWLAQRVFASEEVCGDRTLGGIIKMRATKSRWRMKLTYLLARPRSACNIVTVVVAHACPFRVCQREEKRMESLILAVCCSVVALQGFQIGGIQVSAVCSRLHLEGFLANVATSAVLEHP